MSLSPIGSFQMTPFIGNPIQSFQALALTAFAVNAFANIPMAAALASSRQEICEALCAPLPGGKEDFAEQVCQKACMMAETIPTSKQEICEVICAPLPGDKECAIKKACQESCVNGK